MCIAPNRFTLGLTLFLASPGFFSPVGPTKPRENPPDGSPQQSLPESPQAPPSPAYYLCSMQNRYEITNSHKPSHALKLPRHFNRAEIGYIPACDDLDLKPKIRGSWSRRRRSMDGPQKWPKSSVIKILTINSLTLRILQTLFAQPAPVKRFRRVGGAGTPSSREFVLPTLRNETPPKLGFGRPATNFFRETSTGHS
jgi:hypothetical protein